MIDKITPGVESLETPAFDKVHAPARNFLVLFLSQGFSKFAGLLFGFVAARLLGPSGFGNYAVVSTFLSYFFVATDFGLSPFLVREMSQNSTARNDVFARGLAIRLALATGAFGCILIVGWILHWLPLFLTSLWVGGLGTFLYAWNSSLTDLLTSQEKLRYPAFLDMCCQSLFLILVVVLLLQGANILGIFLALVAANALRGVILGYLASADLKLLRWKADIQACGQLLRSAKYIALLGLMGVVYFKIDILLMFALGSSNQVGWYEGAYRFLEALMVLSTSLMTALFPMLSRLGAAGEDSETMYRAYYRAAKFLIVSGFFCALAVSRVAVPLTAFCYGKDFLPAARLVPVLMIALALIHINAPLGRILLAYGQEKKIVCFSVLTVGCNIALNILLIPRWGAYGAALATVFSEIISFVVFYPIVCAWLRPLPWGKLSAKPLACTAVFMGLWRFTTNMNPWLSLLVSTAGFLACFFALGVLDSKDRQILRRAFLQQAAT